MIDIDDNEARMKSKGEDRVWKTITSRSGSPKKVSQIQLGQQIIFADALKILPQVREWIDKKSSSRHRKDLKAFFSDDDILLQKITESFLLLSSTSHVTRVESNFKVKTRHKSVNLIQKKLMCELDFDLTWRFLEVIVEASEHFKVERSVTTGEKSILINLYYVCTLPEAISSKLAQEAHSAFFPEPMLTPPLDWSYTNGKLVGGYESHQYDLIRTSQFTINYKQYSKKIFDSVNYIQSTSWRVNEKMVEAVKNDLVMPQREDYIKTEYPDDSNCEWGLDLKEEDLQIEKERFHLITESRAIFSEQIELYNAEAKDFESALGKYRAVKLALGIAERYVGEEKIYFPHSYDFRGRIYPLPVGLSPQGSDAVKAMLEYSDGESLNEVGEGWCWAYMSSLFGEDKIPFEERIVRGKELLHTDYKEADEPYQFLAHQLEMQKYDNDNNYKPHIRIHLDACNSGSQFTSAITGDKKGCIATNVIPTINEDGTQERKDAYLLVAEKALNLTKKMIVTSETKEEKDVLRFLKGLLEEDGRKICKTPVMVSNYGGTAGGRSEILWNMFREMGVERKWISKKNASIFSRIIGDSITGVLNGGKAFEIYIHKMNNIIAKKNKPITWMTSDGFHVTHMKNKELKPKQVSCLLPGARKATNIFRKIYSENVSPAKMKSAISPNYIHSLDAELLRRVALKMQEAGIVYSDWIHDSFGCRPNHVDLMLEITKDEFRKLVKRFPLKILDKELREQADNSKQTIKQLEEINIPQFKGFDAMNGGLDVIYDSNWFFS